LKKKYLEIEKYPRTTLQIDQLVYSDKEFPWVGKLDLHGKIVEVKGKATVVPAGTGKAIAATFQIVLSDFGISVPSHLGITMAEKVDISVKFKIEK
jgi:polyisoprenoid-binding protein YceI